MNDTLVKEIQDIIDKLKKEIIIKREVLNSLIEQYQEISDIEIDEDIERV